MDYFNQELELAGVEAEIAELEGRVQSNPSDAYSWHVLGILYKTKGHYEKAVIAYQKAINVFPTTPFYHYNLALILGILRRYAFAIKELERTIELEPDFEAAHASLAGYCQRSGNPDKARYHIERAKFLSKFENEYNQACFAVICGDIEKAVKLLKIALDKKLTDLTWVRNDPDLDGLRSDPRFGELIDVYDQLPNMIPNGVSADRFEREHRESLSSISLQNDDRDSQFFAAEEASAFKRVEQVSSSKSGEHISQEKEDIEAAIAKFKRAVQANPSNAYAWNALGTLYKSISRYADAILAYQQAISLDSSEASYFHNLGLVYAYEGRYEEAASALLKVIEIDPAHSLAHAELGGYYRKLGLIDLSKDHIKKATTEIMVTENEYNKACLQAICGNVDQAIELLRIALKNRQTTLDWVRHDPDLDFIRPDPRYNELVEKFESGQPVDPE